MKKTAHGLTPENMENFAACLEAMPPTKQLQRFLDLRMAALETVSRPDPQTLRRDPLLVYAVEHWRLSASTAFKASRCSLIARVPVIAWLR